MTSFVHVDQPTAHPGVSRAEAAFTQLRTARLNLVGASGLAAFLLCAIVAALVVGTDHLAESVDEGGLLAVWLVMWAMAFVVLALVAHRISALAARVGAGWNAYSQRRASAHADAQFMVLARQDARVMHDLQAAASRQEADKGVVSAKSSTQAPTLYEAMRRVNMGKYY
jgi:hypothetical protein